MRPSRSGNPQRLDGGLACGKLPPRLLDRLLRWRGAPDHRVRVGPGCGVDAAVVALGPYRLILKSDPVTFTRRRIGWYAVQVNANDVAVMGGRPAWFQPTVLVPPGTRAQTVMTIAREIDRLPSPGRRGDRRPYRGDGRRDAPGRLLEFHMTPLKIRGFKLNRCPEAATTERRLRVRVRFLDEPCLWCWEVVDDSSGDEVESSWEREWCGYRTRQEAETAGRARLITIAGGAASDPVLMGSARS
jgi:hypothetical protein